MTSADSAKYIMNSDYPMPAQVSEAIGQVFIPTGTSTSETRFFSTDIPVEPGPKIFRVAIKSSRDNVVYPSFGGGVTYYLNDGKFEAWVRLISDGKVNCRVRLSKGLVDSINNTASDNNFTFYVSSFNIP